MSCSHNSCRHTNPSPPTQFPCVHRLSWQAQGSARVVLDDLLPWGASGESSCQSLHNCVTRSGIIIWSHSCLEQREQMCELNSAFYACRVHWQAQGSARVVLSNLAPGQAFLSVTVHLLVVTQVNIQLGS